MIPTLPTAVRHRVVALVTVLGMITYLDRACIATLTPRIIHDLSLTTVQMGYVFTVFQLAYALFEIPTAKWAEKLGTKPVLTRIVLWWSAFTAATALSFNLPSMVLVRFLFGAGEAGFAESRVEQPGQRLPHRRHKREVSGALRLR